jgi:hypothetical protein
MNYLLKVMSSAQHLDFQTSKTMLMISAWWKFIASSTGPTSKAWKACIAAATAGLSK